MSHISLNLFSIDYASPIRSPHSETIHDTYWVGQIVAVWQLDTDEPTPIAPYSAAPLADSELYATLAARRGAPIGHGAILHIGGDYLVVGVYHYDRVSNQVMMKRE